MWLTLTSSDGKKVYVNMSLAVRIKASAAGAEIFFGDIGPKESLITVKEAAAEVADRLNRNGVKVA